MRIEARKRDNDRIRISLRGDFVWLSDIDEQIPPFGNAFRHFLRRQIMNLMTLIRHSISPGRLLLTASHASTLPLSIVGRQSRLSRD